MILLFHKILNCWYLQQHRKANQRGMITISQLGVLSFSTYMLITTWAVMHRPESPMLFLISVILVVAAIFLLLALMVSRWPVPNCFRSSVRYLWSQTEDHNWSVMHRATYVAHHLILG
jgi:uncharacterized membrane protein YesL